jgi:hypothetical protein
MAPGIAHMRQAVSSEETNEILEGDDLLIFADALFSFGGYSAEKEACTAVALALQRKAIPGHNIWKNFLESNIKRNEIKPIANAVANILDVNLLSAAIDKLGRLLIGTSGYTYEDSWATALSRLLNSSLPEDKKLSYRDLLKENRRLLARVDPNWRPSSPATPETG